MIALRFWFHTVAFEFQSQNSDTQRKKLEGIKTVITEASHVVTHRNTDSARTSLASPIEREGAFSGWYERPYHLVHSFMNIIYDN